MSNSTEIAANNMVRHINIPGLEAYTTEDVRLARWVIVQTDKQSEEWGVDRGQFYNKDTGETRGTLAGMVVASVKKARGANDYTYETRQAAKDRGEDVTDYCKSSDCIKPDPDSRRPQAGSCRSCPLSQFTVVDGKRKPPVCKDRRTLSLLEIETGIPGLFTTYKGANASVDRAVQPLFARRLPPATVPVTITLEKVTGMNVHWRPVVVFDLRNPLDEEAARHMMEQANALADLFAQADEDSDHGTEPDAEDGGPTPTAASSRGRVVVDQGTPTEAPAPKPQAAPAQAPQLARSPEPTNAPAPQPQNPPAATQAIDVPAVEVSAAAPSPADDDSFIADLDL